MRIAHFDCFSGISGDMTIAALVDAGADLRAIKEELRKLPFSGYSLSAGKTKRAGISGTQVEVIVDEKKEKPRKWDDIRGIIESSELADPIKEQGLSIFRTLFAAEAKVHGEPVEEVHLHELGGIDCIVDIFGSLIGLDLLRIGKISVSPIHMGGGFVKTSHGKLPVPAPATAELLKGFPAYSTDIPFELTTPTGAAIIAGLALPSPMPEMTIEAVGYGAGAREIPSAPNLLRIFIGEELRQISGDEVSVIETNIDDMNPQLYEAVMEKLFQAGALDVFLENIIMKKGRPAIKLTTLCHEERAESIKALIFRETTTIGLRYSRVSREVLERETLQIKTRFGNVRVKAARLHGTIVNAGPEYDDLKEISGRTGVPLKILTAEVWKEILLSDLSHETQERHRRGGGAVPRS
ncbi:MAG: nickel pincer cofactor biosynthesis protein LarC [Nitrospirales bacterium]|nr:nickel pincer cofactor biosynthesis protein LarC [Nitrospirales bacterium]